MPASPSVPVPGAAQEKKQEEKKKSPKKVTLAPTSPAKPAASAASASGASPPSTPAPILKKGETGAISPPSSLSPAPLVGSATASPNPPAVMPHRSALSSSGGSPQDTASSLARTSHSSASLAPPLAAPSAPLMPGAPVVPVSQTVAPLPLSSQDNPEEYVEALRTEKQDGWSCFDIAVGFERAAVVTFALENAGLPEFRRLLASEIRHAAAVTAIYMNAQVEKKAREEEDRAARDVRLTELFGLVSVLDDEAGRHQLEEAINQLLTASKDKAEEATPISGTLPRTMHNESLCTLVNAYDDAHEAMKMAVRACNEALGFPDGRRLSLEQLDAFFREATHRERHAQAHANFAQKRDELFAPAELAFNTWCESEVTYRQYVSDYYGSRGWVAFQRSFAGETTRTSMVDIAARLQRIQIIIYQKVKGRRQEIYRTAQYGAGEVAIQYNGRSHFIGLHRPSPSLASSAAASSGSSSSSSYTATPVVTPTLLVSPPLREDSASDTLLVVPETRGKGKKAAQAAPARPASSDDHASTSSSPAPAKTAEDGEVEEGKGERRQAISPEKGSPVVSEKEFRPMVQPSALDYSRVGFFSASARKKGDSSSPQRMSTEPYRTAAPQKTKLSKKARTDIGRWGEDCVYLKLKNYYESKYGTKSQETPTGFMVESSNRDVQVVVTWHNKGFDNTGKPLESGKPLDLEITKTKAKGSNGKLEERVYRRYIEVKTTTSESVNIAHFSPKEFRRMRLDGDRYSIFRVNNAGKGEDVHITKIRNPWQKLIDDELPIGKVQMKI